MVKSSETERKERMDTSSLMKQILSRDNLNRAKNLNKLGVPQWSTWKTAYIHGYECGDLHIAINNKRLASFGLVSMLDYYTERCVTCEVD